MRLLLKKYLKQFNLKKFSPPCISETILSKITKKILLGLAYLHKEKHQIHSDIKPANFLINTEGIVKLIDLEISRTLEKSQAHTFVGSRIYMSPERINCKKYIYPSDIWRIGLIIYELATGTQPYGGRK